MHAPIRSQWCNYHICEEALILTVILELVALFKSLQVLIDVVSLRSTENILLIDFKTSNMIHLLPISQHDWLIRK